LQTSKFSSARQPLWPVIELPFTFVFRIFEGHAFTSLWTWAQLGRKTLVFIDRIEENWGRGLLNQRDLGSNAFGGILFSTARRPDAGHRTAPLQTTSEVPMKGLTVFCLSIALVRTGTEDSPAGAHHPTMTRVENQYVVTPTASSAQLHSRCNPATCALGCAVADSFHKT
jgi:hypothetical protein